MKRWKDISVMHKMLLGAIVTMFVVLFFSSQIFILNNEKAHNLRDVKGLVDLSLKVSKLVHETQKERGRTAGYMGSGGKKFIVELPQQRKLTDEKLKDFNDFLDTFDIEKYGPDFVEEINEVKSQLRHLNNIRNQVTSLSIPDAQAIGWYTSLNSKLLGLVNDITTVSRDSEISKESIAYYSFLLGKERAGIERAVGSNTFAANRFKKGMFLKFHKLITEQNAYMALFEDYASKDEKSFYEEKMRDPSVAEVDRMRGILLSNFDKKTLVEGIATDTGWGGMIYFYNKYLDTKDDRYYDDFMDSYNNLLDGIEKYKSMATSTETKYLNTLEESVKKYKESIDNVKNGKKPLTIDDKEGYEALYSLADYGNFDVDAGYWFDTITKKINLLKQVDDKIAEDINKLADEKLNDAKHSRLMSLLISLFVIIAGMVVAGIVVLSNVIRPLERIGREAKEIAETGDLSKRLTVESDDEVGKLGKNLNDMLDGIAKPVKEMADRAQKIASGDLTVDLHIDAKGDINNLLDAFKTMTESLQNFVGLVNENVRASAQTAETLSASSEEVNASTEQVASTVQEIAKGAQNLTMQVAKAKEALEKIGESSKMVAEEAKSAAEGAREAGEKASKGIESGKRATEVMEKINASSSQTAASIQDLDQKSSEIGKIIEVINNISEQTNLLALNAAIEAARAGEAGRGFAVVADEVRKLAEESQKATNQIAEMITSIQESTKSSVKQMEGANKAIVEGTSVVGEAINALKEISEITHEIAAQIEELSNSSDESSKSVEGVLKSMQEVSAVAEESAAGTEEVSASVEETASSMQEISNAAQKMAADSEKLKTIASKFKVDEKEAKRAIFKMTIRDHRNWVKGLYNMLEGKKTLDEKEVHDDHSCRLGKWYYGVGMKDYGNNETFKKIEDPHKRVHAFGKEAIKAYNEGNIELAKRKVKEAEEAGKEVVALLEEMIRAI